MIKFFTLASHSFLWKAALLITLLALFVTPAGIFAAPLQPGEVSRVTSQIAEDDAWWGGFAISRANPSVTAMDGDGNIYTAGYFPNASGQSANAIARWNGMDWQIYIDLTYQNLPNQMAVDEQGVLYAAFYSGADSTIRRWDGSQWETLADTFPGVVYVLAPDGNGNLYVGGSFTTIEGVTVNNIARWNGSQWSDLYQGLNDAVRVITFDRYGNLYAGGDFSMLVAEQSYIVKIARWNGSYWSRVSFDGGGVGDCGGYQQGSVQAMAWDPAGENLYVAGSFGCAYPSLQVNNIARWNGGEWYALGSGLNDSATALAFDASGHLIVAGQFRTAGGVSARHVARWDGSAWHAMSNGLSRNPDDTSLYDIMVENLFLDPLGRMYAVGHFRYSGERYLNNFAYWDGSAWQPPAHGADKALYTLKADTGGGIYAGGAFTLIGDAAAPGVARWENNDWSPLGSGIAGTVRTLEIGGGRVYAGGWFTSAGGVSAGNIAGWDGASWQALGVGLNDWVYALVAGPDGSLYAGGAFTQAGGAPASRVARWDGSQWHALGSGVNDDVYALAVGADGQLYAGGWFTQAGGAPASHLARWDGGAWQALPAQVNGDVYALAFGAGGVLYAGGDFTSAGGVSAGRVARWDGSQWSALGSGMDHTVRVLAVHSNGTLTAGGDFTTAGGMAASRIADWDGSQWSGLGSGLNGPVNGLAEDSRGDLYVGGEFTFSGGKPANYIARRFKPYRLSGSVSDSSGAPVSGVTLSIYGGYAETASTADGSYSLENLPAGVPLALAARSTGCARCTFTPPIRWTTIDDHDLAGQDFVFYYAVTGHVIDDTGRPVGGVTITNGLSSAVSDADGAYTLGGLDPGEHTLIPERENFVFNPSAVTVSLGGGEPAAQDFTGQTPTFNTLVPTGLVTPTDMAYNGSVVAAPDGAIYAYGPIVSTGGVPSYPVYRWDGSQWQALGAAFNGAVYDIAADVSGNMYAIGAFTNAGTASVTHIARWDGTRWRALGLGFETTPSDVDVGPSGAVYVVTNRTTPNYTFTKTVYRWDGSAWQDICPNTGYWMADHLAVDGNDHVYAVTRIQPGVPGTTTSRVVHWDGSTWQVLGGLDRGAQRMVVDQAGRLFIGGYFNSVSGSFGRTLTMWDGTAWHDLGVPPGVSGNGFSLDQEGNLLAVGGETGNVSIWDGAGWTQYTTQNLVVNSIAADSEGNLFIGGKYYAGVPGQLDLATFHKRLHFIEGRVEDGAGNSVAGARIASGAATATTGADGRYLLNPPPDGAVSLNPPTATFTLAPSLPGCADCAFVPETRQAVIAGGNQDGQDFTVLPSYSISGAVRDGSGNPVAGAQISADGGRSTITAEDGRYTFTALPPGTYTVTPLLPGCAGCTFTPASRQVDLQTADATGEDFTAVLSLAITGAILDGGGSPLEGVTVSAGAGLTTTTAADGTYAFTGLAPESYTITPSLPGCAGCAFTPASRQVALGLADSGGQDFTAALALAISGTVQDSAGSPLAGVTVSAGAGLTTTSAADGTYAFAGLLPGSYTITPSLPGCAGCAFAPASRQVTLELADSGGQDFTAALALAISGTVQDSAGSPLAGVTVSAGAGLTTTSAADGTYAFAGLLPGSYTITPSLPGCAGCTFAPASRQVTLELDDSGGQDFTAALALAISGAVRDGQGSPVVGVTVSTDTGRETTTGAGGIYSLSGLLPGAYTLTASLPGCAECTFAPASRQVTLGLSDVSGEDFTAALLLRIAGKVVDENGDPVQGIILSLGDGSTTTTVVDGTFLFDGLAPGAYTLTPRKDGCESCTFDPAFRQVVLALADESGADFVIRERMYIFLPVIIR